MLLLSSYSLSRPSFISSAAAIYGLRGTGEMHDPCNLKRHPQTHSLRHPNRYNAVHLTILTSLFLRHSPMTHSSLLHPLSAMIEAVDPKHSRLMTGPSRLHDALSVGLLHIQIPRVGNFLDDPYNYYSWATLPGSCCLRTTHF